MMDSIKQLYPAGDPRSLPNYSLGEAAHYLGIPPTTLRAWVRGQRSGSRRFQPVIRLPDARALQLSFVNLVEAHILNSLRRQHEFSLQKLRKALRFVGDKFGSDHPLAQHEFATDGYNLFIQEYERLISVSEGGQLYLRPVMETYLQRLDWAPGVGAIRLYPFTHKRSLEEQPKYVVIDPLISFGRPVLAGTGVPTAEIADRYKAEESIEEIASDFGRSPPEIHEALRCELRRAG